MRRPCDESGPWLSAYHDGELGREERARAERHLEACAACRDELAAIEALAARLAVAPRPDAAFLARFRARRDAEAEPAVLWRRLALRWMPIAAAALLAAALTLRDRAPNGTEWRELEAAELDATGVVDEAPSEPVLRIAFGPFPSEAP